MEGATPLIVTGLLTTVANVVIALLAQRYGLLGKKVELDGKKAEAEPAILQATIAELKETRNELRAVKVAEEHCQREVHQLKGDLQTTWLAIEMILLKCPQADEEVEAAIRAMKKRQKDFLHGEAHGPDREGA